MYHQNETITIKTNIMSTTFLQQTAKAYDMKLSQVQYIYEIYPNNFYEKLEEFIKARSQA